VPSQKQVRWSELRVGITVIAAAITLVVVILLMSSTTGLFQGKLYLTSYFDNASGLRIGAPVRLQGVDIGNVIAINVDPSKPLTPVVVTMKVSSRFHSMLRTDSVAMLGTAGVLGETFVDIDSSSATGPPVHKHQVLGSRSRPAIQDVILSSQSSLKDLDALITRLNNVVGTIQEGKGSVGKMIYDASLYNRLNATLGQVQNLVTDISQGKGSIGKLIETDDLYKRMTVSLDKLNGILDQINSGQGTAGKFVKDPSLYNNANQTISKANQLMDSINQGHGALGKFAHDEAFARKLDTTITNLQELTTRMNKGEGTVGRLFNDPSVYNNTDNLLTETRNLIAAIRKDPKKYLTIHLKLF
jgi:phospholipid/cholesterol/gamma-HCH transport system substrate-binding protein